MCVRGIMLAPQVPAETNSMSDFFIGQIMMTGFSFAPRSFAQCNGQLLPINQNQALFALLGTQFGGDGVSNFGLPDLRSRTPVGFASSAETGWQPPPMQMGQRGGSESVTLSATNVPAHTHTMNASTAAGDNRNPRDHVFAASTNTAPNPALNLYAAANGPTVMLSGQTLANSGGNQAHPNLQPYTTINFCIALTGIFPSRD